MLDVAIIGGGFSGLALAQTLQQAGRSFAVFESRSRFGGRILSAALDDGESNFHVDLGPSWVWPESQPRLARFIEQYSIETFPHWVDGKNLYQHDRELPALAHADHSAYQSARRINGGVRCLLDALLEQLPSSSMNLNHHLWRVENRNDHVRLHFSHHEKPQVVHARKVVITIPPRLLVDTVMFQPALNSRLIEVMRCTDTWMAGHAKAVIHYDRPFWRDDGFSGNALASYQGVILAEVFDVCSADGSQAALSGFFALPAVLRNRYRNDLDALIIDQLVRLFGSEAANTKQVIIQDWFEESLTATQADAIPPDVHPQYGHFALQLDHWNDKLYFAGSETAVEFGGYLEGALVSAERVAKKLLM